MSIRTLLRPVLATVPAFLALALPVAAQQAPAAAAAGEPAPVELAPRTRVFPSQGKSLQAAPAAAVSSGGGRLVWHDEALGILSLLTDTAGATPNVVVANDLLPTGKFRGEVTVHRDPAIAIAADGSFLLAWSEQRVDRAIDLYVDQSSLMSTRVVARRFGADGKPLGPQVEVASGEATAAGAAVTAIGEGWLIAWHQFDAKQPGVHLRSFDAKGKLGKDQLIGPGGNAPVLAASGRTGLVAWARDRADEGVSQVYARPVRSDGEPLAAAISLGAANRTGQQPAVAAHGDSFLVVWEASAGLDPKARIYGQTVSAAGKTGPELELGGGKGDNFRTPAVAALADGGWLVAWLGWTSARPTAIGAAVLDAGGRLRGNVFQLDDGPFAGRTDLTLATDGRRLLAGWVGKAGGGVSEIEIRQGSVNALATTAAH